MRGELERSYILHARKYGDTSLILELLGLESGRNPVIAKGARSAKPRFGGRLQPFTPLLVAASGRGELRTVTKVDVPAPPFELSGDGLLMGMYVNELLYRLLGRFDAMPGVFGGYEALLGELAQVETPLLTVRRFELLLLQELGYGIDWSAEATTGAPISGSKRYSFEAGTGFVPASADARDAVPGALLERIAAGEWRQADEQLLRHVTRAAIRPLLGNRPLKSRGLFEGRSQNLTQNAAQDVAEGEES